MKIVLFCPYHQALEEIPVPETYAQRFVGNISCAGQDHRFPIRVTIKDRQVTRLERAG